MASHNQTTNKPATKKGIQAAKSLPSTSGGYGPGSKVKGPDATPFGSSRMGGGGTTGGKSGTGAQYDTTSVSFSHPYNEAGASRIVKSLHK